MTTDTKPKWEIREPLNMGEWEPVDGADVEDAIERWADRMDAPNDYFISNSGEMNGVDLEVRGEGIDGVVKATVYPEFHTTYSVRLKQ